MIEDIDFWNVDQHQNIVLAIYTRRYLAFGGNENIHRLHFARGFDAKWAYRRLLENDNVAKMNFELGAS